MKIATCTFCYEPYHTSLTCWKRTRTPIKATKPIPKIGNIHKKWAKYRKEWKAKHKDEIKICHICGKQLPNGTFTLDHVIPRSRRPDLVFVDSNIKPACWTCNLDKGSKVYPQA